MVTRRDVVVLALALAGAGIAGYLTYTHYDQSALVCGIGDCSTVQASEYAKLLGIPIAIFGLTMYLALAALMVLRIVRTSLADLATTGILMLLVAGTIYAAYLTYIEIWVIEAICQWCVASALITLILLLIEGGHVLADYRRTIAELETEDA